MRCALTGFFCVVSCLFACGPSSGSAPAAAPSKSATEASASAAAAPPVVEATLESVGLDASALDRSVEPCTDFYQFSCGKWLERTEIPSDEAMWTRSFNEIRKRNELELKEILEAAGQSAPGTDLGKLGTFYAACMDETAVEAAGKKPLLPLLAQAAKVKDRRSLAALVIELHSQQIAPFFEINPVQDPKDATRWIADLDQGGLGLPDRDYYLREDERSLKLRQTYLAHVERMLVLAGTPVPSAQSGARDVLELETELAKVSKTRVERREPKNMFNRFERSALNTASPGFDWDFYFDKLGLGGIPAVNLSAPKFFSGLSSVLSSAKPAALHAYLDWQIVHGLARHLSQGFVNESFRMDQALTGQAEIRPRWRRCLATTDNALGDLLGQAYVQSHFAGASKAAAENMVHAIHAAFQSELGSLSWMDPSTRERAGQKLAAMGYLIGYPEQWKTYGFDVDAKSHAQNVLRARAFDLKRELGKVGNAVDEREWQMSAPTVNAYYSPQRNHMVFPAGILQPPFYDVKSGVAVNLGAIGMVVGHELTHGFDDEGSQYDAKGNLADWWAPEVGKRFKEKTECVAQQYSAYEVQPGLPINGQLTLGENIADLGGVKLAFAAYRALRQSATERISAEGFNEDQQFFLAVGQAWCAKGRPEYERMMVQVNPHSVPRFRVRGALSGLPEFATAFACPADAPMLAKNACSVW